MDHSVDVQDFAVLYGFSLFETFAVNGMGVPFMLERHIDRLIHSMRHFDFTISSGLMDHSRLCSETQRYISSNNLKRSIVRATVAFGNPVRHIQPSFSITHRESPYTAERYEKGFVIGVASFRRYAGSPLLGHKTANRIENLLADKEAAAQNMDDMLFVNTDGHIMETSRSNVFFINYIKAQNGILRFKICTPALSCGLLPGVIRQWLISDVLQKKDSSGKCTVESIRCAEHAECDKEAEHAEYAECAKHAEHAEYVTECAKHAERAKHAAECAKHAAECAKHAERAEYAAECAKQAERAEYAAECAEGSFTVADLQAADEIFLTNSAMGIMPVSSFNGLSKVCDVSLALSKNCRQLITW